MAKEIWKNPYVIGGVGLAGLVILLVSTSNGPGGPDLGSMVAASNAANIAGINAATSQAKYAYDYAGRVSDNDLTKQVSLIQSFTSLSNTMANANVAKEQISAGLAASRIQADAALRIEQGRNQTALLLAPIQSETSKAIAQITANTTMAQINAQRSIAQQRGDIAQNQQWIDLATDPNTWQSVGNIVNTVSGWF